MGPMANPWVAGITGFLVGVLISEVVLLRYITGSWETAWNIWRASWEEIWYSVWPFQVPEDEWESEAKTVEHGDDW